MVFRVLNPPLLGDTKKKKGGGCAGVCVCAEAAPQWRIDQWNKAVEIVAAGFKNPLATMHSYTRDMQIFLYNVITFCETHDGASFLDAIQNFFIETFHAGWSSSRVMHIVSGLNMCCALWGNVKISTQPKIQLLLNSIKNYWNRHKRVRRSPISINFHLPKLIRGLTVFPSFEAEKIKILLLLGYFALLRMSEAMRMNAGQISFKEETVEICVCNPKIDQRGPQMVRLTTHNTPKEVLKIFIDFFSKHSQDNPFEKMSARKINQYIHKVLGITFFFHSLRHGRATDLRKQNWSLADIMRIGRWASLGGVMCYLHV